LIIIFAIGTKDLFLLCINKIMEQLAVFGGLAVGGAATGIDIGDI
jgi:hypothetical protein